MKRIIIIAALAAVLLEPIAAAAQGYGRGGRWGDGDGREHGRGGRYEQGGPPFEGRGGGRFDDNGGGRWNRGGPPGPRYEPNPEIRRREDPRNAPPPYPVGRNGSWRRGDYLPPMYRGGVVRDPGRFRLRAPPPGYDWIGVGPDIYLMQRSTGMVLDTVPGGY